MNPEDKPISELISSETPVDTITPPIGVDIPAQQPSVKPKKSKTFPIIVGILSLFIIGMGGYYVYNNYIKEQEPDNTLINDEESSIEEEDEDLETSYGVGEGKYYFETREEMTHFYGGPSSTSSEGYPLETIEIDGIEYEYLYKTDGTVDGDVGMGAVYQWEPTVEVQGYEASRMIVYYNVSPCFDETVEGCPNYPEDHPYSILGYSTGDFTEDTYPTVVNCIFDLSKLVENGEGFIVYSGNINTAEGDNCESLKEDSNFNLGIEDINN